MTASTARVSQPTLLHLSGFVLVFCAIFRRQQSSSSLRVKRARREDAHHNPRWKSRSSLPQLASCPSRRTGRATNPRSRGQMKICTVEPSAEETRGRTDTNHELEDPPSEVR